MYIGIDVGGTHTDAALALPGGTCLKAVKVPTQHESLTACIISALTALLHGEDTSSIHRVCVSSTLGLNALLTRSHDPVGIVVVPGPGMNSLQPFSDNPYFIELTGAQDHRGIITTSLDEEEVFNAFVHLRYSGIQSIAIISKFSPKNPELETHLACVAKKIFPAHTPIITGSSLSGSLNFPRRVHTAWCAAALTLLEKKYLQALEGALRSLGLQCSLAILKADAGTLSIQQALTSPLASLGSGPAAGLLAIKALACSDNSTLAIDIGGTTTDIALLVDKNPLLAPKGLHVAGHPTLLRSLWTSSIAVGGDSPLQFHGGKARIHSQRLGPALAFAPDGKTPTLTDALNTLGLALAGNSEASRKGLTILAASPKSPTNDPFLLAQLFLDDAVDKIYAAGMALLHEINAQPVYTIREVMLSKVVEPQSISSIGTPAKAMAQALSAAFSLPVTVPEEYAVANAIGTALARPTHMAELYADTELGKMRIPSLKIQKSIDSSYTSEQAAADLSHALAQAFHDINRRAIQITYSEVFSVVTATNQRERIIKIGAQLPPGLLEKEGTC